jgi:hypothetical protein
MNMADTAQKIATTNVSLKAFFSVILTVLFTVVSFWDELPLYFKVIIIALIVLEVIAPFLGVKKIDAKEGFEMVLSAIQRAKEANPKGDFTVLNSIEAGIMFLVQFWDKVNNLFKGQTAPAKPAEGAKA